MKVTQRRTMGWTVSAVLLLTLLIGGSSLPVSAAGETVAITNGDLEQGLQEDGVTPVGWKGLKGTAAVSDVDPHGGNYCLYLGSGSTTSAQINLSGLEAYATYEVTFWYKAAYAASAAATKMEFYPSKSASGTKLAGASEWTQATATVVPSATWTGLTFKQQWNAQDFYVDDITVTKVKEANLPTSITVEPSNVSGAPGSSVTLTAAIEPADTNYPTVTWSSNNTAAATVDSNGVVTFVADGTATITATTVNNLKATATVTADSALIKYPEAVTMETPRVSVAQGGTATLSATVLPTDASNKTLTWTSDNTAVATVDGGVVTAVAEGEATITAETTNGKRATARVIVLPANLFKNSDFEDGDTSWGGNTTQRTWGETLGERGAGYQLEGSGSSTGGNIGQFYKPTSDALDLELRIRYRSVGNTRLYCYAVPGYTMLPISGGGLVESEEWTTYVGVISASSFADLMAENANFSLWFSIEKTWETGTIWVDSVSLFALDPNVTVTQVVVNAVTDTVETGDTLSLSASLYPVAAGGSAVTWKSSAPQVASVDANGTVTGLRAGTANITCTAANGKSDTVTVTVVPKQYIVNGDFESNSGWTVDEPHYWASDIGENGTGGVYLEAAGEGGSTSCHVNQTVRGLTVGKTYRLTFRYRSVGNLRTIIYSTDWTTLVDSTDAETAEWADGMHEFTAQTETIYLNFNKFYQSGTAYVDNVSLVEVIPEVQNGTITSDLDNGAVAAGTIVKVTVTPDEGYVMIPGTLKYVLENGDAVAILNKDLSSDDTFGEGDGCHFQFVMPEGTVTLTADYMSTAEQSFAVNTIGTACRYTLDENDERVYDGIRFLTRLNVADGVDVNGDTFTLRYGGETYTVLEMGTLLKRAQSSVALTYENALVYGQVTGTDKMWISKAYTAEDGLYRLVDYTDSYFDFTVVMRTAYPERFYTARGYIRLQAESGEIVTLECDELTNSISSVVPIEARSITLTPETVELSANETVTLNAEILPEMTADKTVVWSSSDNTIATVDNGTVTGVAVGTATITATTANGKQATATVTVLPVNLLSNGNLENGTTGWIVDAGTTVEAGYGNNGTAGAKLSGGSTGKLERMVYGLKAYTKYRLTFDYRVDSGTSRLQLYNGWSYMPFNTNLDALTDWYTVDKTFVTKTDTWISLSFTNAYSASACTYIDNIKLVEVGAAVMPEEVTITPATIKRSPGAEFSLQATVLPSNTDYKSITWASSAPDIVFITPDGGVVTVLGEGTATITATAINGVVGTATVVGEEGYVAQGTLSVTSFGAVPDDGLDDQQAFQAAFNNSVLYDETTIIVPAGTYQFRSTVNVKPNITLQFEEGAKLLRARGDATQGLASGYMFFACNDKYLDYNAGYFKIYNGVFDGNWHSEDDLGDNTIDGKTITSIYDYSSQSLAVAHLSAFELHDCLFIDGASNEHMIDISGCSNVVIEGCEFRGTHRAANAPQGSMTQEVIQIDLGDGYPAQRGEGSNKCPSINVKIYDCLFTSNPENTNSRMIYPIGTHTDAGVYFDADGNLVDGDCYSNIEIYNNVFENPVVASDRISSLINIGSANNVNIHDNVAYYDAEVVGSVYKPLFCFTPSGCYSAAYGTGYPTSRPLYDNIAVENNTVVLTNTDQFDSLGSRLYFQMTTPTSWKHSVTGVTHTIPPSTDIRIRNNRLYSDGGVTFGIATGEVAAEELTIEGNELGLSIEQLPEELAKQ